MKCPNWIAIDKLTKKRCIAPRGFDDDCADGPAQPCEGAVTLSASLSPKGRVNVHADCDLCGELPTNFIWLEVRPDGVIAVAEVANFPDRVRPRRLGQSDV
jgi:hypothetical protein